MTRCILYFRRFYYSIIHFQDYFNLITIAVLTTLISNLHTLASAYYIIPFTLNIYYGVSNYFLTLSKLRCVIPFLMPAVHQIHSNTWVLSHTKKRIAPCYLGSHNYNRSYGIKVKNQIPSLSYAIGAFGQIFLALSLYLKHVWPPVAELTTYCLSYYQYHD